MNIRTLFLTTLLVALNQVNGKYITGWCNITSCNNNGKCVQLDTSGVSKYWCLCADGFSGDHCEQPPCPDICMNDGVCTKPLFGTMSDYYCKCPAGYEGQYCEKEVETSICDSDPCGEYGTCMLTSSVEDFRCDCMNGWQGPNCSEKSPCPAGYCNRGTCSIENGNPVCSCPDNFTGSRCELYADLCAKNPCQNGATCHSKLGDFDCICKPGFIGGMCEYNATALFAVDKCSQEGENSCQNGGLCRLNTYAQWTCVCPPMFEGSHCQDDVNECDRLAPCLNGATCHNYDGSFQCICPIGYDGEFCEIKEEYCSPNPCQHGGQCVSEGGRAFCHCPPGKIGNFCEKIDACMFNPCKNNASCHTEVSTGDYQCACPKGFTGKHCDQDVDECAISANACYNNGTCVNKYGGYECRCPESFSGAACEKVDLMCSPNPCLNNGQCMDLVNDYECACLDGFYGDNCEFGKSSQTFCKGGDCQNGGSCHFGVCSCQKGFSGILCEESDEKKNHCLSNPCHHGICLENGDDYRCHCYPGFTGRDCHINFDDCKPGLCLNDGTCVDGDDSFTCSCKKGFSGKHCEERIDMEKFNHTETRDKELCAQHGCSSLAGNGRCDQQCNHFACGFDGGDCSAKAKPYEKCETASYCARAFHDGYCDEICNNENCLFDGFDCSGSPKKCPYAEYCENNYNNGHCNSICNTTACGFDGGDCENKEKEEKLNGEIVLVVLTSPNDFRRRANTFLMTLSATLRASVKIRSDSEGPMVYEWIDGQTRQRIILDREQPLSVQYAGVIRGRRAANEQGVIVWLTVDMTNCKRDCFSDIATVADFLGRAEAQNELEQLGMPIKEARIDHRENEETSSVLAVFLVIAAVLVFVTFVVFSVVNRDRTRKRRIISAPTWYPPTDTQYKAMQQQAMDFNFHQSLYGSQGELGVKRTRIEGPQVSSFFNGAYSPPLIVPNQVFAKPHTPAIFPDFSQLHEQASSRDLIPLPINRNMVNERNGPGGVTPLILLAKNKEKDVKLIIKDMDNLYKAGANLDAQDEAEQTALFIAVKMGRLEVAQKLLGLGANPTKMDYNDSTPLHQAVHNCDLIMVRELLKNDAVKREIHEVDKFGRTALMASAFTDILSTEVAAALIEAGADPSYQGDKGALTYRGRSATHYAAQCGNTKMLKFLIEKGANKDAQDLEECTPLILAVRAAQQASVEILVAAGASQEISDQTEASPRSIAKEMELDSILEILEKARKQYDNMVEVPLPETKPRTMKQTSKRAPQKRKHQPLTPPHSDGTSTPPETSHLDRPLICPPGLDSPHSSSSNKTASPNYSHPMGTQGFPRPSPPYDCDWSTLMPPGTAYAPTCQLQQTFTSDYNSASSSFDTSSFNFGGDYSNASSSW